jgi:hypothetical protein
MNEREYALNDCVRIFRLPGLAGRIVAKTEANAYGRYLYRVDWDDGKTTDHYAADLEPEAGPHVHAPYFGGKPDKTYLYRAPFPLMLTPDDIDVDGLIAAVIELREAWRDDNQVFSVRVMRAVGEVVRTAEGSLYTEAEQALGLGGE